MNSSDTRSALTWSIDRNSDRVRVELAGEITETSDFGALLAELSTPALVVDLAGVKRINSCGVREWIHFIHALEKSSTRFSLERCSVPIVNQLNIISNFKGNGRVLSVFAPYFCDKCNEEALRLIDLTSGPAEIAESAPCPKCGAAMEFDDLPEQFLSFSAP